MTTQLSKLEERDLHAVARRINERETVIAALKTRTEDAASQAVTEAILQGQDLIKAKATVPHGLWLDWMKTNCPGVQERMAQRYMKVARNASRVADLNSLREALAICGEASAAPKGPSKKTPEDLQALYLFSRATRFVSSHPLDDCPEETREEIRRELEPIAKALWPERFE